MAEIVVSAFFTVFFEKLASEALHKIARIKGIDSELNKLKRSLTQIQALLHDASQKEITQEAVKVWLNGLHHLAYDIDDILDDLATEAMHREFSEESGAITSKVRKLIPTCCPNLSVSSRVSRKLDDISAKLQELMEAKNNPGLIMTTNEKPKIRRNDGRVDEIGIVGREGDKKALIQKLLGGKDESCNQNFSIVPIVGMGGVGKTTLARLLYEEKEVKDHFEVRAWVCVSEEFDISNISKIIYENVSGENKKFEDLNQLQDALKEKLKNKLFLIVLDDVWSERYGDWEKVVGLFLVGAPGSKIIMTTRKEQLLRQLGYAHLDPLKSLSHGDALSLFAQHALGVDNFDSQPTLRPLGVRFVRKCDGLPLALRTLGRLLRTKTDDEEWKELLNSEIWTLGENDEIGPALRLSYHDLSASLKQLFAYCSLFPKDYVFDKEELILLWMAEGFLHQSTTKSMERLGREGFEELMSRSFFQLAPNDKSLFVMHDLMNDLATSVAGDFFSRLDIETKKEFRKEASEKYRHLSFVCEEYMVYKRFEALKGAKNLRTFLALSVGVIKSSDIFYLSNKVLDDLLHELPMIRVLKLRHLSISEVPESIGKLKSLRYLNLSGTEITHLPDNVCNLYNLQTLIVSGCRYLKNMPKSFSKLKNLRHLDMRDTPYLKKMPLGILELKGLQTLYGIVFEANLSETRLSELEVKWSDEFDGSRKGTLEKEVLNMLKPCSDTLKSLGIVSYGGIEFPSWVGDPLFGRLTGCKKCKSLPLLGQLPLLKKLVIAGMDDVKVVGPELLGTGLAFPSLEILYFENMCGWEEWLASSGVVDTTFPCLQKLHIKHCPNLVRVSLEALPSLSVLEIDGCDHEVLRSLVRVASSITELNIRDISGLTDQVWGGVIEYLGAVEEVKIESCNEIRYLWESEAEASKVLVHLSMLDIRECSKLVGLGEKEEDNCGTNLTSLTNLYVSNCDNLEHCSCPNSLKSLLIWECNKLMEKEWVGGREKPLINSNILMLQSVIITKWPNLKSITELSSFNHLRSLIIRDCPNMESFPEHEFPKLSVLTHLRIMDCQSMDASFSRGLWPPKLSVLHIGGLKKPISKWGPQNFPASLVRLGLYGGPSEDVSNLSRLSHLFPSSLTCLIIDGFEKVESASVGL